MVDDRIYQRADEKWYFDIRGKTVLGPYETHALASRALRRYVRVSEARCNPSPTLPQKRALWRQVRRLFRSATRQT